MTMALYTRTMPSACEQSVSWPSHTMPRCPCARLSTPKAQQRSTPNEAAAQPEPREAIRTTRSKPRAALEPAETQAVVRQQSRESRRTTKRSSPPQSAQQQQQAVRPVPPAKAQPAPAARRAAAQVRQPLPFAGYKGSTYYADFMSKLDRAKEYVEQHGWTQAKAEKPEDEFIRM